MNYTSFNDYCIRKFGQKVYKIAIDAGFTCPNRDGTLDSRGCIFCSNAGSGDFAESRHLSITNQIEIGKNRVIAKMRSVNNPKFIAYFQAFTNSYGPIDELRKRYEEALIHPEVIALSIATRPDCLPDDVISLMHELQERFHKPIWVELGLQTIHKSSSDYIRRCYELPIYDDSVTRLKSANLEVITHVILGLPGETKEMMLDTVRYVCDSKVSGIKLQLLHVIDGTDLALDYTAGKFEVMDMQEYVHLVADCIEIIPEEIVIHRMTGDGNKMTLIAPLWSADKKRVLNALRKEISSRTRYPRQVSRERST